MATYIYVQPGSDLLERNKAELNANGIRDGNRRRGEQAEKEAGAAGDGAGVPPLYGIRKRKPGQEEPAASGMLMMNPVLLLHMDGTNGSTTFLDSGVFKLPVTATGYVSISTDEAQFNQSGKFEGNIIPDTTADFEGGSLSVSNNRLTLGIDDFTVEFWIYCDSNRLSSFDQPIIVFPNAQHGGIWIQTYFSGVSLSWVVGAPSDNAYAVIDDYFTYDQWHHIAAVRRAGVVSLFVDGTLQTGSQSTIEQPSLASSSVLIGGWAEGIGNNNGTGLFFRGFLDEVRILKGKAAYTSNFTPPAAPF